MSYTQLNIFSGNDLNNDYDPPKDDFMDGDVEFDEPNFGSAEYLYDLATTTETAIALGSLGVNANYDAMSPMRQAHDGCMKQLSDGKGSLGSLRETKPVRFTDGDNDVTIIVSGPLCTQGAPAGAGKTQSTVEGAKSKTFPVPARTKLEFYSAESNLWMTQMHIGRVGNSQVHIGFRVEAMHILWDLTRTAGLRKFLYMQGATAALLNVFDEFCPQESTDRVTDEQGRVLLKVLDVSPSQWFEEEQMRALGMLSLLNLMKVELREGLSASELNARKADADLVVQTVLDASPQLFERIVDLCARFMTNCGNRGLYSLDRCVDGAVGTALAPYNLACEAKSLVDRLYRRVQPYLDQVAETREAPESMAKCCERPPCVYITVGACDALHAKLERLSGMAVTKPASASVGHGHEFIRSQRLVVC